MNECRPARWIEINRIDRLVGVDINVARQIRDGRSICSNSLRRLTPTIMASTSGRCSAKARQPSSALSPRCATVRADHNSFAHRSKEVRQLVRLHQQQALQKHRASMDLDTRAFRRASVPETIARRSEHIERQLDEFRLKTAFDQRQLIGIVDRRTDAARPPTRLRFRHRVDEVLPARLGEIPTLMDEKAVHGIHFQAIERSGQRVEDQLAMPRLDSSGAIAGVLVTMRARVRAADIDRPGLRRRHRPAQCRMPTSTSTARARIAATSRSPGRPSRLETP